MNPLRCDRQAPDVNGEEWSKEDAIGYPIDARRTWRGPLIRVPGCVDMLRPARFFPIRTGTTGKSARVVRQQTILALTKARGAAHNF